MKKNSILVKTVLMSMFTAGSVFSFTSCADDIEIDKAPVAPETEMNGQTRAASSDYNINQHNVIFGSAKQKAAPFNTKEWQNEQAIFCYVGEGGDTNIQDSIGNPLPGFKLVNLPWSNTAAASNIPPKIWKEMMPNVEARFNPWKLVLMNCGKENVPNGNFLGFYNELSGVLRIFVYVPKTVNAEGSTHMWGLLLNDKMASRSIFRYGVPTDKSITTDRAKQLLDQTDEMAQIISPWKRGNFSGFNDSPLSPGWWAFDMDFSVYRDLNNETTFTSLNENDDILSVKTLCKKDESLKMESKLLAKLDGKVQLEATQASTSSGIFAPLEDLLGKANEVASLVDIAKSVIDPNPLNAIENGIKLAKGACNLAGIDYGSKTEGFNGYKGNINLNMDGTIDTKGVITNQANVSGMYPISLKKSDFLTANCRTFGEGIWNLKSSPVVYYTNASVDFRYMYNGDTECSWYNRKSPFKGQLINDKGTNAPYHGQVCYFDPSSIELVLNDKLFTQDEIKNAKVYATCGVRKGIKFGDTETYRNAIGLEKSQINFAAPYNYPNRPLDEAPFDALSSHKDKMKMETKTAFEVNTYNEKQYGVFGRGDAEYLIEPQALCGGGAARMMPAYEVTVTVVITKEITGEKLVYSRTYLPEYMPMHIENMPEITDKYIKDHMPTNYASEIYKQQMAHINDIRNWTRRCTNPTNGTPCHQYVWLDRSDGRGCYDANKMFDSLTESYATLFDNDLSNRWASSTKNMWFDVKCLFNLLHSHNVISGRSVIKNNGWTDHPCWYAEFMTNLPSNPTSYSLIASNNASKIGGCNPRVWALYGKKNQGDDWTLLAMSSYNNQPEDMLPKESNKSTRKIPFRFHDAKGMKFYRFEVLDVADENLMCLGELRFNYD